METFNGMYRGRSMLPSCPLLRVLPLPDFFLSSVANAYGNFSCCNFCNFRHLLILLLIKCYVSFMLIIYRLIQSILSFLFHFIIFSLTVDQFSPVESLFWLSFFHNLGILFQYTNIRIWNKNISFVVINNSSFLSISNNSSTIQKRI